MRALFAARALAAVLVLVPIQARLEPLLSAAESELDSSSHTSAAESGRDTQVALPEVSESALSARSDSHGEKNRSAAAESTMPGSSSEVPISADAICAALDKSATQHDLPLDFFTRLIWQESRFNPLSVSHAGAQGIAQFMPATARRLGLLNPFDPIEALPKAAELLRELRAQFGNLGLAAAAYNAGPKRVLDWLAKRKVLPQETEAYVRIITGRSAQEWTDAEARIWNGALPAPAPCAQLARPAPLRSQPVVAVRRPQHPARAVIVARQPDRAAATTHHAPARGVKLAQLESKAAAPKSIIAAPKSMIAVPKTNTAGPKTNIAAAKGAAPKSNIQTPKSIIASPKSNLPAPKNIIATPKSEPARAHHVDASSARGSTAAEASHALRREQPAASHRRPAGSRTAREA